MLIDYEEGLHDESLIASCVAVKMSMETELEHPSTKMTME